MPPTLAPGPTRERQPRRPAEHGHPGGAIAITAQIAAGGGCGGGPARDPVHVPGEAVADTQRAGRCLSLLRDGQADDARGPDAEQALIRLVNLAARLPADLLPPEP
jgi:hypothetical protein